LFVWFSDDAGKYSPAAPATSHEVLPEVDSYIPVDAGTASVKETYEVVYEDVSSEKSLQEAKDNEARTHLKEKLCRLGLAKEVHISILSLDFFLINKN
jgi:hypothetical protein